MCNSYTLRAVDYLPIQLRDQTMKQTCLLMAAFAICMTAGAQTRYLDEVFSDVDVTSNIQYGTNVTVITALQGQPPAAQPLVLDLYEPAGDTETDRPLLLLLPHRKLFAAVHQLAALSEPRRTAAQLRFARDTPKWATSWPVWTIV